MERTARTGQAGGLVLTLPPQATLRALLVYDPATGALSFRATGKPAMQTINGHGYRHGRLLGRSTLAARAIWKLVHGDEPPQIDHRNGDRADNRLDNLRRADWTVNNRNAALRKDSTTGICGVSYDKRSCKFRAYIWLDGRQRHLGLFDTVTEAAARRADAVEQHGFSERHGLPL